MQNSFSSYSSLYIWRENVQIKHKCISSIDNHGKQKYWNRTKQILNVGIRIIWRYARQYVLAFHICITNINDKKSHVMWRACCENVCLMQKQLITSLKKNWKYMKHRKSLKHKINTYMLHKFRRKMSIYCRYENNLEIYIYLILHSHTRQTTAMRNSHRAACIKTCKHGRMTGGV